MRRAIQALTGVYALLCVVAVLLIPASAMGWFNIPRDPLSGVFANILAMPWSLGLRFLHDASALESAALIICAMAVNVALLFWLAEIVGRPAKVDPQRAPP